MRIRFRATILIKLLAALVLPTITLFALFATIAYQVSKRDLDDELGRRLEAIAASAATQIRAGKQLLVLERDQEDHAAYRQTVGRLEQFARATGVQLSLFDRDYRSRGDSQSGVHLTDPLYRAQLDLAGDSDALFVAGRTVSSVTFTSDDGKIYKAGYAPVHGDDPTGSATLALRAQAPASYFERLEDLRDRLLLWGGGLVVVSVLAAVAATLLITRNVRRLAAAAARIGSGDLRERIAVASRDEIGQLAQAMERMRQQLAERDARMQQMLAGIAHEVRNPLAGMTLFAGILRDELPPDDERRGHVDKIQRELGYLERVVNDFLEYARRPKPEIAPFEVGDLLAEVAQLAANEKLEIEVVPTTLTGHGDVGQLRRAVLNLTKNGVQAAIAANQTGRAVRLSATHVDDELRIAVWNRGKEIPVESSGKLFEPFYTTREKGTGLGLAFVREIASDHQGRIELASAGGETTFTLVIPWGAD